MIRTLKAFAWMRWRVLMNSLDRTSARDTLERLSLAVDQIAPFIAVGLFIPMAVALAGGGVYAGYSLATASSPLPFNILRILLVVISGLCILGPLLMPSLERASAVRLLLLPIRRETLYLAQAASTFSEPWILMAVPPVMAIPVGLVAGGSLTGALMAVVAGVLLILTLISLVTLSTTVLHLIVRDRRRGELVTLGFVILISVVSLLPGLLGAQHSRDERRAERAAQAERRAHGEEAPRGRAFLAARWASTAVPSELYARITRISIETGAGSALLPLAALAATAGILHAIGFFAFRRLLASPGSSTRSRVRTSASWSSVGVPGLSRGAAAVAQAQLHLVLRTPRGRSTVLMPVVIFGVLAVLARRSGEMDIAAFGISSGLGLTTFGASIALLSILPIAMNQFAIDRAGLTLALLTPLNTRQLLIGKAAGNAMAAAIPVLLCLVLGYLLFQDGHPALWISLPLTLLATYLLVVPAAAALSALFPRAVDLNSIGSRSNAHGLANLLGMLSFSLSALPPGFLAFLAIAFERPLLAPVFIAVWCGVALILSRVLLNGVVLLFEKRRENLALTTRPAS